MFMGPLSSVQTLFFYGYQIITIGFIYDSHNILIFQESELYNIGLNTSNKKAIGFL